MASIRSGNSSCWYECGDEVTVSSLWAYDSVLGVELVGNSVSVSTDVGCYCEVWVSVEVVRVVEFDIVSRYEVSGMVVWSEGDVEAVAVVSGCVVLTAEVIVGIRSESGSVCGVVGDGVGVWLVPVEVLCCVVDRFKVCRSEVSVSDFTNGDDVVTEVDSVCPIEGSDWAVGRSLKDCVVLVDVSSEVVVSAIDSYSYHCLWDMCVSYDCPGDSAGVMATCVALVSVECFVWCNGVD